MLAASRSFRPLVFTIVAVALIAAVAIPALAADPSSSPTASAAASAAPERQKPSKQSKPDRAADPQRGAKPDRVPEVAVTLKGTVGTRTTVDGDTEYTLTVGSTVLTLEAGPSWFYGDKHPLKPFVGKSVTVVGEQATGSTEVDVRSVDGIVIRSAGRPPWAGGWKVVGKIHPGWSQEKWDKWQAKIADRKARFGVDCWPPGQCRGADGNPITPSASTQPSRGD